jgi:hypothetical protein
MRKILILLLGILPLSIWGQGDSKVSALTATTSLDSADIFYVVEGGTSKKVLWYYMQQTGFPVDVRTNAAGLLLFESFWLGEDAGLNATSSAFWNYGIGTAAFHDLTSGDGNSALGFNSGYSLTSGSGNDFQGLQSGYGIDTASYSISTGYQNMYAANGRGNISRGYQGAYNIIGAHNIFDGWQSGYTAADADYNVGLGYRSMYALTSGDYNTAINFSLDDLTSGDNNVGIGYNAGDSVTTASNTVVIGSLAGQSIKANSNLVYIGASAGLYQQGVGNTGIGYQALKGAYGSAGTYGTAVGYQAGLVNNSTGSVFVGAYAGSANTSEVSTALGYMALRTEATSTYNTAVGYQSMQASNGAGQNTTLGYQAGTVLSTGDNNTFLGYKAGDGINTGSNNTFIGYDAGGTSNTASGSVKIGYMVGGADNSSNTLWIDNSSTATPLIYGIFDDDSLVVNGDLWVTGDFNVVGTGSGVYNSGSGITIDGSNNIDLGGALDASTTVSGTDAYPLIIDMVDAASHSSRITFTAGSGLSLSGYDNDDFTGDYGALYVDNGSSSIVQFDGAAEKSITMTSGAFTVTDADNTKGMVYAADYSANYTDRSIPDWDAVTDSAANQLGGQALNSNITSPGAGQDGDVITWDNGSSEWTTSNVVDAASSSGIMVVAFDTILYSNTSATTIVTLPEGAVVWDIQVYINTAFNGSGTDLLDVGITGSGERYEADLDLSTGSKWYGLDNVADRMTASTNIIFQYADSGADASAGLAFIYVHYSIH